MITTTTAHTHTHFFQSNTALIYYSLFFLSPYITDSITDIINGQTKSKHALVIFSLQLPPPPLVSTLKLLDSLMQLLVINCHLQPQH